MTDGHGASGRRLGRFTTNPGLVWSEHLADYYGTHADANGNGQTGDNYAVGGARIVQDATGELGPMPSLSSQVQRYLVLTGGRADPDALYTVGAVGMTCSQLPRIPHRHKQSSARQWPDRSAWWRRCRAPARATYWCHRFPISA